MIMSSQDSVNSGIGPRLAPQPELTFASIQLIKSVSYIAYKRYAWKSTSQRHVTSLTDITGQVSFQQTSVICVTYLTLYCTDRPKPPNPSYAQTVQNHPVNSQFVGLSFTAITSFFYINQPAQTADLSSM